LGQLAKPGRESGLSHQPLRDGLDRRLRLLIPGSVPRLVSQATRLLVEPLGLSPGRVDDILGLEVRLAQGGKVRTSGEFEIDHRHVAEWVLRPVTALTP
ncbi:MAG: hypothetical protein C4289_13535, partial [Chloroflexota bacterium]